MLRSWFKYTFVPGFHHYREKAMTFVAWRMPKWLVYWCSIRLMAHATQGPYSTQVVPDLRAMDALERWKKPKPKAV